MNREKIINEINKEIKELIDILEDDDLIYFKKELDKAFITIKVAKELTEKLKGEE
jgi:hypothetical protein